MHWFKCAGKNRTSELQKGSWIDQQHWKNYDANDFSFTRAMNNGLGEFYTAIKNLQTCKRHERDLRVLITALFRINLAPDRVRRYHQKVMQSGEKSKSAKEKKKEEKEGEGDVKYLKAGLHQAKNELA